MPNTYARGILFGKMVLELCDVSSITCQKTGYSCDVDFKAKVCRVCPADVWPANFVRAGFLGVITLLKAM